MIVSSYVRGDPKVERKRGVGWGGEKVGHEEECFQNDDDRGVRKRKRVSRRRVKESLKSGNKVT